MACNFLAVPATSISSKQIFCLAGQIFIKYCCNSSLNENIMHVLIYSKNWLGFQEVIQEKLTAEQDLLKRKC